MQVGIDNLILEKQGGGRGKKKIVTQYKEVLRYLRMLSCLINMSLRRWWWKFDIVGIVGRWQYWMGHRQGFILPYLEQW
jgi:hypothetical protein